MRRQHHKSHSDSTAFAHTFSSATPGGQSIPCSQGITVFPAATTPPENGLDDVFNDDLLGDILLAELTEAPIPSATGPANRVPLQASSQPSPSPLLQRSDGTRVGQDSMQPLAPLPPIPPRRPRKSSGLGATSRRRSSMPEDVLASFSGKGRSTSGTLVLSPEEKRLKRILANRESAHRSRMKKMNYVADLERQIAETTEATENAREAVQQQMTHRGNLLQIMHEQRNLVAALKMQVTRQKSFQSVLEREVDCLRRYASQYLARQRLLQQHQEFPLPEVPPNTAFPLEAQQQQQQQQQQGFTRPLHSTSSVMGVGSITAEQQFLGVVPTMHSQPPLPPFPFCAADPAAPVVRHAVSQAGSMSSTTLPSSSSGMGTSHSAVGPRPWRDHNAMLMSNSAPVKDEACGGAGAGALGGDVRVSFASPVLSSGGSGEVCKVAALMQSMPGSMALSGGSGPQATDMQQPYADLLSSQQQHHQFRAPDLQQQQQQQQQQQLTGSLPSTGQLHSLLDIGHQEREQMYTSNTTTSLQHSTALPSSAAPRSSFFPLPTAQAHARTEGLNWDIDKPQGGQSNSSVGAGGSGPNTSIRHTSHHRRNYTWDSGSPYAHTAFAFQPPIQPLQPGHLSSLHSNSSFSDLASPPMDPFSLPSLPPPPLSLGATTGSSQPLLQGPHSNRRTTTSELEGFRAPAMEGAGMFGSLNTSSFKADCMGLSSGMGIPQRNLEPLTPGMVGLQAQQQGPGTAAAEADGQGPLSKDSSLARLFSGDLTGISLPSPDHGVLGLRGQSSMGLDVAGAPYNPNLKAKMPSWVQEVDLGAGS